MVNQSTWSKTKITAPEASDAPQSASFELGSVSVAPGEVADGRIDLGVDVHGKQIGFQFRVFHGKFEGPRLLVQGGVHGDEYDGQEAVRRFFGHIDTESLRGTVIAIPCINESAFVSDTRESSVDGVNFNRVFPGSATGSFSARLADLYINTLIPAADVMVDIHTGGAYGQIAPLTVVQGGFEALAEPLGIAALNPILWKGGAWGGTSRIAFLEAGKPAVTLEYGGGAYKNEIVEHHLNSLVNIARALGMIDGEAATLERYERVAATFAPTTSGGYYVARAEPGDRVAEGTVVAEIVSHLGEVREQITAPNDGVVLWIRRRCATNIGEESIIFGTIEEELSVAA